MFRAGLFEEGLDYSSVAFDQTDSKPVFIYFHSAFLFALGKIQESISWLEKAITVNPKFIRQFIELDPSMLSHPRVSELLARVKKRK